MSACAPLQEDDWHFIADDEYISKALRILEHDQTIAQVLLNEDDADTDSATEREVVLRLQPRITFDGLQYTQHVHGGPEGSPELADFVAKHAHGKLNRFYWPGFSLRPSLWRLSVIKQFALFETDHLFQRSFGVKLPAAGYKVAFLDGVAAVHLAPGANWLKKRQDVVNEVYARHRLRLQYKPGHQQSAYDANVAER
jgi:hypothetical protein